MNVNCKLTLTDMDRNILACFLSQKDVRRFATRKEVNELVYGFLESLLDDQVQTQCTGDQGPIARQRVEFDRSKVPTKYLDKPLSWQMGWYRGRYIIQSYAR